MSEARAPTTESSTLKDAATRRTSTPAPGPALFLVLDAERPLALPARWRLDGVKTVDLVRSSKLGTVQGTASLTIRLPDAFASSSHARLERGENGWTIEDRGSKNGTLVNGTLAKRRQLEDGDLLEIGHTFLIFRAARAFTPDEVIAAASDQLTHPFPTLTTIVPELHRAFERLPTLAASSASIVIHGETGTGKEVVARAIHGLSGRSGRFVAVNCGAIPDELVESELFGYERGAFTGAMERRQGLVRSAEGGTLFLDEIGDLPLHVQTVLLRVMQEREVTPVGADRPMAVDVRLIAATHRDLDQLVAEGRFRDDLYGRLGSLRITLPPLRERREDLGLLIGAALRAAKAPERIRIEPDAARMLMSYGWPRNVRELHQDIEAAALLTPDEQIRVEHLPDRIRHFDTEAADRQELERLLRAHQGNMSAVARAIGKDRKHVQRWLLRHGINVDDYRR